jgi:hypothetical protein
VLSAFDIALNLEPFEDFDLSLGFGLGILDNDRSRNQQTTSSSASLPSKQTAAAAAKNPPKSGSKSSSGSKKSKKKGRDSSSKISSSSNPVPGDSKDKDRLIYDEEVFFNSSCFILFVFYFCRYLRRLAFQQH